MVGQDEDSPWEATYRGVSHLNGSFESQSTFIGSGPNEGLTFIISFKGTGLAPPEITGLLYVGDPPPVP